MKNKIVVKNLYKSFGDLRVLEDISFSVKEGELLCVVGPSGCGKTTLLKALAKLIDVDRGEILIDGIPPDPRVHRIGYVPQNIILLPWRNVYQNIGLGLEIRGVSRDEAHSKIMETIDLIGLNGFERYYPHEISVGMMARVAIARAMVIDPDIMLLDEPFANLDAQTRYVMQLELLRLHDKHKITMIFVTHNVEEALILSDRLIVLTHRPAKVKRKINNKLDKPRDRFSKEFIELRERIEMLIGERVH